MKKGNARGTALLWAEQLLLFLFAGALLLPFLSLVIWSLFSTWGKENMLPHGLTMSGFSAFFSRDLGTALRSVAFSAAVSFATLALCIPASRGVIVLSPKMKRMAETVLYLPMLMPVVSVCMGAHKLLLRLSLTGTPGVFLMHVYFAMPYVFALTYSCYAAWGLSYETSAYNLGCGWLRAFAQIHLPIYRQGYKNAFFMGFIVSYSQYFVNFYLGGWQDVNFAMILAPYITGSNRHLASAYTMMYLLLGAMALLLCSCERKKNQPTGGNDYADD